MIGVDTRLTRLFDHVSRRCFDIALDHGFFGEASFLPGIEDLARTVQILAAAGPDAIQLAPGQAHLLQSIPDRRRPALVLRADVANVYGQEVPDRLFSAMIPEVALTAVRLDAACVVVNLFDVPGRTDLRDACIANVLAARADCERYGMPLMVEPLVMKPHHGGRYASDGTTSKVVALVRQAVELGADVIKSDPTDVLADYHLVVQTSGRVPVLVRGGGRVDDDALLSRTAEVLAQGAAGIVYGRNVIAHRNPAGITRALMAILHGGATVGQARAMIDGR